MSAFSRPTARFTLARETVALLEALAAIALWGISFISIKLALAEVSPVTLIVVRFALGALVLGGVAWRRGELARLRSWPQLKRDLPALAGVGLVGITLQQLLQVSGQATADASVAAFLAATAPAFTVALAALFLRETLRPWQIAGVLVATAGAALVATNGDWAGLLLGRFGAPGNLLVLASSVVWALLTILSRKVVQGRPPTFVTAGMFFFGGLFAAPLFVAQQGWRELAGISAGGWGAILFTSLVCTAGAYLLNTRALQHLSASRVALIQNVEPAVAVTAAALVLGEAVTLAMLAGGAAILGGVYFAERSAPVAAPVAQPAPQAVPASD